MTLLESLAYRLEEFVYDGVCGIARWSDRDGERGRWIDRLASPDGTNPQQSGR